MRLSAIPFLLATFVSAAVASVAVSAEPPLQNNTWGVWFGDPTRGGNHTTTITVSYSDANGVKKEKEISASVTLTNADTNATKKEKVEGAVNTALSADGNTVGGEPLAETGGTGNAMTITPSPNNPPPAPGEEGFSDAKIEKVETEDDETGEDDRIIKPGKKAVAQVEPAGELLGTTRDLDPSIFFVTTNLGTVSVQLTGSMSKIQLLKTLREGLVAKDPGLVAWVDTDLKILFVLLKANEGIVEVGCGSTDLGLTARCSVQLTE
jgi:hypothetical protein